MSKLMKGGALAFTILLLATALMTAIGTTFSYFTTYTTAKGTIILPLEESTDIEETFDQEPGSLVKHVVISNTAPADSESSRSVFVRAKAFSGSIYPLEYVSDGSWSLGEDGYYYYSQPLTPGEKTSQLDVKISGVANADIGTQLNVAVIYETTPVLYDENGVPYADWNALLDNGDPKGGDE